MNGQLKVKRLTPTAQMPSYATAGAACFDLHADIPDGRPMVVPPGYPVHISTGLAFEVPAGYVLEVFSRSGHGFKNGVRLVNAVGVIDSDYRGPVQVGLHVDGRAKFTVKHGDRIAQARLVLAPQVALVEVQELGTTARGAGGFGSTGR